MSALAIMGIIVGTLVTICFMPVIFAIAVTVAISLAEWIAK